MGIKNEKLKIKNVVMKMNFLLMKKHLWKFMDFFSNILQISWILYMQIKIIFRLFLLCLPSKCPLPCALCPLLFVYISSK